MKRTLLRNSYNALGQLKERKLGQKLGENGLPLTDEFLEAQDYTYHVRGWLKGINYTGYSGTLPAFPTPVKDRWFAMDLSYEYGYEKNQMDGNIAGMRWKTFGNSQEFSYGYDYDKAGRLLLADFLRNPGTGFIRSNEIDFKVRMGNNGTDDGSAYDENGNILLMQQWGITGVGVSNRIDFLRYTYFNGGNKLKTVSDDVASVNKLGDFSDKNTTGDDYGYDVNGNLVTDKNKQINGATGPEISDNTGAIRYNHMNLPWKMQVYDAGNLKGTVTYIYDAEGNRLEKQVEEIQTKSRHISTTYLDGYVYENNVLQYFDHEEGRIRPVRNSSGTLVNYAFDYYLKDHLGNIRVVLTDEKKTIAYPVASLENAAIASERLLYDIPENGRTLKSNIPGIPEDSYTSPNLYVHQLSGSAARMGSSIVLKVMAGDKVNIRANSWYPSNSGNSQQPVALQAADLLTALAGGIAGAGGGGHTAIELANNANLSGGATAFLATAANEYATKGGTKPKAYLSYILFDEQLNVVLPDAGTDINSGMKQVEGEGIYSNLTVTGRDITRNGYLYVFVSNETPNIKVCFDNLQVTHVRGPLQEETHYYPFGLTMAGISSKAGNIIDNKTKYNGIEFEDDLDVNVYGAFYRTLDPQTGRWWQIDPQADVSLMPDQKEDEDEEEERGLESLTPYNSMANNPVRYNDPKGDLFGWDNLIGAAVGMAIDYGTQVASNISQGKSMKESFTDVDGSRIVQAGIVGFVTSGVGNVAGKVATKLVTKAGSAVITKLTPVVTKLANSNAFKGAVKTAERFSQKGGWTSLKGLLDYSGYGTKGAEKYFGWQGKQIVKSLSDFSKKKLIKDGWSKDMLRRLANAYNDQIRNGGKVNPVAIIRRDQIIAILRRFF